MYTMQPFLLSFVTEVLGPKLIAHATKQQKSLNLAYHKSINLLVLCLLWIRERVFLNSFCVLFVRIGSWKKVTDHQKHPEPGVSKSVLSHSRRIREYRKEVSSKSRVVKEK